MASLPDFVRRSPIHRRLAERGAAFETIEGALVPMRYGDGLAEVMAVRELGLADLSAFAHAGGGGVISRLTGVDFAVPHPAEPAWLLVCGKRATELLARICPIDLRPSRFPGGQMAQTLCLDLAVTLIRADLATIPAYHLLFDRSCHRCVWDAIEDAMSELGGHLIGYSALSSVSERC